MGNLEIGRILQLKSENRNFKLNPVARMHRFDGAQSRQFNLRFWDFGI